MAYTATDGSQFTNKMTMNAKNSSLAAKPSQSAASDPSQPKSIQDDPKAMQLVDELKQMGFTGDDVAQAMDGDQQSDDQSQGQQAVQAAPLQIPGM